MTTCEYSRCGKEIDRGRFCNRICAKAAWAAANREKCRQSLRESRARFRMSGEPRVRRPSKDKAERYARIKEMYGVPGMGIAPNTSPRVRKATRL